MAEENKNIQEEVTPVNNSDNSTNQANEGQPKEHNYFAQIFIDMFMAIKDKPSILFGILTAFPGIFIGLFLNDHIYAYKGLDASLQLSGVCMFGMELVGCINIYNGFNIASTRRLFASVKAAIGSLIFTLFGSYWLYCIFSSETLANSMYANYGTISSICVIISIVATLAGTVGSFFFYNHNYKKD